MQPSPRAPVPALADGAPAPRVLIVDDDANILGGMRRMFRALRPKWDITFATGGLEALEQLENAPFDVVVSDIRMPQLDGVQLLSAVQTRFPDTVRVILSGYAEQASVLRTVASAHQYVAKPSDVETIVEIIDRATALRRLITQAPLRELVSGLGNLPTPTDLYRRLTAELDSPRASVASVSSIIATDVAMSAELLKLTNSSFFSLARRVSTTAQAINILGFDTLKALVVRSSLFRSFAGAPMVAPLLPQLNSHSHAICGLARAIARMEKMPSGVAEQAAAAGLLAQIGALVLLDAYPEAYLRAIGSASAHHTLAEAERAAFGVSQAEVGAYLLGLWGFPDPVIEAVAYALNPGTSLCHQRGALVAVHAARALGPPFPLAGRQLAIALDETFLGTLDLNDHVEAWRSLT